MRRRLLRARSSFSSNVSTTTKPLRTFETLEPRQLLAADVVINEIHYDSEIKTDPVEFVELYNAGDTTADLANWRFSDGIDYVFSPGTTLPPDGYIVVSQNPSAVQAKFGVVSEGPFLGRLSNDGERVQLRDANNTIVDEVSYGVGFPWPIVGDGDSIELIHPSLDNDLGGSWRSSSGVEGTSEQVIAPGAQWRYFKGTEAPSATHSGYRLLGFDDSAWPSGQAPIGYGENFIETSLSDMRGGYSTFYARREFNVADSDAVGALLLEVQYDDGINVWINGSFVAGANVSGPEINHTGTANSAIENVEFVPFELTNPSYLRQGVNVIAVQVLNASINGSSDAFFDARLVTSEGGNSGISPGLRNATYTVDQPPHMRQVEHSPKQPQSGEDVTLTIKVTDADGVDRVELDYQLVDPGDYIERDDPRYETQWTTVAMLDSGTSGDQLAGDDIFTVVLPGALQTNRRLVRYRIRSFDTLGNSVQGPYADDTQPNFAYYVYDGAPDWTGKARPGAPNVTYDGDLLSSVATYHLITTREDHVDSQFIPNSSRGSGYGGSDYRWQGAFVYDGEVYDHIQYRARGGVWRYSMGKNMWKFDFNRGHEFQARDDYGNKYATKWDKLNFSALIQQGNFLHRGEQGLFESVGFKLFNLAGVESPHTNYVSFRIVEDADEGGPNQYSTDFQGLYLAIEQPDGNMLDEHDLPDGNLYKMESGTGTLNNQGPTQPTNKSDLNALLSAYNGTQTEQFWRDNLDLERYYSYRAIVEGIHHYDIANGKNYFYYHNPETNQWQVHPWDLDLTWANNMFGSGNEPFKSRITERADFRQEYRNRLREVRDLLYNDEQTGMLIDELAGFVYAPGEPSLVDADRAMWDYNPILTSNYINNSKAGHGRFYESATPETFAGMIDVLKDYVDSRGNWIDNTLLTDRNVIPDTPVASYTGAPGFASNGLTFQTSAFAGNGSFGGLQWRIAEVTDTSSPTFDPLQPRSYEITSQWESGVIETFDAAIQIPADNLEVGKTYRVRVRMGDSLDRWSHWSEPVQFTLGAAVGSIIDDLRVTEINYNPTNRTATEIAAGYADEDFEFIELQNVGPEVQDLGNVRFIDGIDFNFTGSQVTTLAPNAYALVVRNLDAFQLRYGAGLPVAGEYSGGLRNSGETLQLVDANGGTIQLFEFNDGGNWPGRADGNGATLNAVDVQGDYSNSNNWRSSTAFNGSPGGPWQDFRGDVVLNEVLTHTDLPQVDAVELYNTTSQIIDIGGWYLSDSSSDFRKFRIPDGTTIDPNGYLVFDENDFNATLGASASDFAFSGSRGDDAWLSVADATGKLTRVADHLEFGAAANGESFGRTPNGTGGLAPMREVTLGTANSAPRVGPVVISEVMYNPTDQFGDPNDFEFIELYNSSSLAIDLTDWVIDGGVEYDFPNGTIIPAHDTLTLVSFDPQSPDNALLASVFQAAYGLPAGETILGGYAGVLDNGGERIQLLRPDEPPLENPSLIPMLLEDEVRYDDDTPWPITADGSGNSLQRRGAQTWGNDVQSWTAASPTAGRFVAPTATVVGRQLLYNNSYFDGFDASTGASDNLAIAVDKQPLLRGQTATFANYSGFHHGINGIVIDVIGLSDPSSLSAGDFDFRIGNDSDLSTWTQAPAPINDIASEVQPGGGVNGSDRITLVWPDGAIQNTWLEITTHSTLATGIPEADVFYFGSAIGDIGNSAVSAIVDGTDFAAVRDNSRNFMDRAPVNDRYDMNRDSFVDGSDLAIVRDNFSDIASALKLITPGTPQGQPAGALFAQAVASRPALEATEEPDTRAMDTVFADPPIGQPLSPTWAAATDVAGASDPPVQEPAAKGATLAIDQVVQDDEVTESILATSFWLG